MRDNDPQVFSSQVSVMRDWTLGRNDTVYSPEGDRVSYVSRLDHANSHFDNCVLLSPSLSPWHGPQFQVLRVEMFRFSSSKISIYESSFLPEPTTRAVCREGGSETEFATAGTWFVLEIEQLVSSCAILGFLWKVHGRRASHKGLSSLIWLFPNKHSFRAQIMSARSFPCAYLIGYGTCRLFHTLWLCKRVFRKCIRWDASSRDRSTTLNRSLAVVLVRVWEVCSASVYGEASHWHYHAIGFVGFQKSRHWKTMNGFALS